MQLKKLLQTMSGEEREELARKAETTVAYLYQIAGGHRQAGSNLAKRLVAADQRLCLHKLRPDLWAPTICIDDKKNRQEQANLIRKFLSSMSPEEKALALKTLEGLEA